MINVSETAREEIARVVSEAEEKKAVRVYVAGYG